MSARRGRKVAAREARLAREAQVRVAAMTRRRLLALGGSLILAASVVVAAAAISSGGESANAASGGGVRGGAFSARLFAGIPQHGAVLGRANTPVRLVEFADLQCPYCDEYALEALPTLVRDYVRTGRVSMRFVNLSFIGAGSVVAGRAAAAAAEQDELWNFVDLMYLNQGEENTGYVTPAYLRELFDAVPSLDVPKAVGASQTRSAEAALARATAFASAVGVDSTPSFLIGRSGGRLRLFQPSTLTAAPFAAEFDALLKGSR
jgi:protein-disulfide isomerase